MKLSRLLQSLAVLSTATSPLWAQPQPVAFDWFEYSGQDSVESKTSTSVIIPAETNVSSGLSIFQNERHNYFLAVRHDGDGLMVCLERANGRIGEVVGTTNVPSAAKMKFHVEANDTKCTFEYAADADDWKTLVADADATLLTTEVAGGFVGATVGMHARIDSGEKP
jgi:alpha-N-arabinofuranosidase